MKRFIVFSAIAAIIAIGISVYQKSYDPKPVNTRIETKENKKIEILAKNLEIPWEIEILPNKDLLFTERSGKLKLLTNGQTKTIANIPDVKVFGEGGLMGLALHPDFSLNNYIYLYYTYEAINNQTKNRVIRYKLENNNLSNGKILIDNIPGAVFHNGGRIKFGPDGFLYITTGDSLEPSLSQDTNSLAGKILRATDEGEIAPDNPFNNLIYSYGHRNPQGLAWDEAGRLFETEHGNSAHDEINIIVKGKNYGWPVITGDQTKNGMEPPFAESGAETWAPAGAEFLNGTLFFGGLRGQTLFGLKINNGNAIISKYFIQEFGRIRAVTKDTDGFIYISTSNRDGRGSVNALDDKIIKIDASEL